MDTHEIKKKRGKIVSLSSGMHRKLLAFYGKGENVILLKFWKQQLYTRLLFLSIMSRNKQCKLMESHSNDS